MLHGVERNRGTGKSSRPAPYMNLPALAAFMVLFGAVGYLLVRNLSTSALTVGLFAIVAGAAAWMGMSVLMAKWALRPSEQGAHSEAEAIQGLLAVVVSPIGEGDSGSIRYERSGIRSEAPARGIDQAILLPGTDVVIDRFEDGVAIVEDWAAVERRL